MLNYKKMSIFDAPKNSILVFSVNTGSSWNSGVAGEMKKSFPKAYEHFKEEFNNSKDNTGKFSIYKSYSYDYKICSLITANIERQDPNNESNIIVNTVLALDGFLKDYNQDFLNKDLKIYSVKFNSGLFQIPWNKTEVVLRNLIEKHNTMWTVCDPSL